MIETATTHLGHLNLVLGIIIGSVITLSAMLITKFALHAEEEQ